MYNSPRVHSTLSVLTRPSTVSSVNFGVRFSFLNRTLVNETTSRFLMFSLLLQLRNDKKKREYLPTCQVPVHLFVSVSLVERQLPRGFVFRVRQIPATLPLLPPTSPSRSSPFHVPWLGLTPFHRSSKEETRSEDIPWTSLRDGFRSFSGSFPPWTRLFRLHISRSGRSTRTQDLTSKEVLDVTRQTRGLDYVPHVKRGTPDESFRKH